MKSGSSQWLEVKPGMSLDIKDLIKAGAASRVEVTFFEGTTIELEANTEVEMSALGIAPTTQSTTIRLKQNIGKTVSRVTKLVDAESRYEVETPAAVAAVRGSIMHVMVDANGMTTVANEQGSVWVTAQGVTLQIPEGMQSTVTPGQTPSAPVPWTGGQYVSGGGGGGGGGGGTVNVAAFSLSSIAEPAIVRVGDTVIYTYRVLNTGNTALSDVTVIDSRTGTTKYESGDSNSNGKLDVGEEWLFRSSYLVKLGDTHPLVCMVTVTTTDVSSQTVTVQSSTSVSVESTPEPSEPGLPPPR
ncbi:MAG: FecR domain-containing protein [Dehalococcoidales bacterium]|nr:FecR domain-containing protein [Dehalococcoidales bacterium]